MNGKRKTRDGKIILSKTDFERILNCKPVPIKTLKKKGIKDLPKKGARFGTWLRNNHLKIFDSVYFKYLKKIDAVPLQKSTWSDYLKAGVSRG
jgi:hypothetical protein